MNLNDDPLARGWLEVFKIPTRRTVTEWADAKRMLPSKGAAEPGKYRSSRTPYMREPMDCLSVLSPVQEVVIMAGAQLGKSESLNNAIGYVIDEAPGPMLMVQPTVDNAKRYSKQRISPMILETPSLAEKVMDNKSRDGGNTMLEKEFPGGILIMGGANSAAGLRSMPIRFLLADEISNWPDSVDGEGDPLKLAEERTNTFGRKRKVCKTSTPGTKDICRIERELLKTDFRRYYVPCPHCCEKHTLEWKNFVIPKDENGVGIPEKAYMVCPSCGGVLEEKHKTDMLNGGEWRPTRPENISPRRRGYQISGLYSPIGWKAWADCARQWIEAQSDPELLKAFVNNVLAETWEESYQAKLDAGAIKERAEAYELLTAPEGVLLVTAGVDVQHDRIETQITGWGEGEECWVLNYAIVYGDPTRFETWSQVLNVINTPIRHATGVDINVSAAIVDSGDGNTSSEVYAFCRDQRDRHILAGKGMTGPRLPIGSPSKQDINIRGQKVKNGVKLYPIGVDAIKSTLYGRLKRGDKSGPGVIHFPLGLPADYFDQLTAEKQMVKFLNGHPKRIWVKKDGARNEALDTWNYAYAALHYWISRHNRATFWEQMKQKLLDAVEAARYMSPEVIEPVVVENTGGKIDLSGWRR